MSGGNLAGLNPLPDSELTNLKREKGKKRELGQAKLDQAKVDQARPSNTAKPLRSIRHGIGPEGSLLQHDGGRCNMRAS